MAKHIKIPRHVGIIMDGNRRWARERGFEPFEGHRAGYENLRELVPYIFSKGVSVLTVFALSTENYQKRGREEIEFLFDLFREAIEEEFAKLAEENIRIRFIGDRAVLPADLQESMQKVERDSAVNTGGIFVPAVNYGGQDEIVRAVRRIVGYTIRDDPAISKELVESYLDTSGLPSVDLIIRTAGEQRLSGFLLWQASYAEFYTSRKYWPAFSKRDFVRALKAYETRERRLGGDKAV